MSLALTRTLHLVTTSRESVSQDFGKYNPLTILLLRLGFTALLVVRSTLASLLTSSPEHACHPSPWPQDVLPFTSSHSPPSIVIPVLLTVWSATTPSKSACRAGMASTSTLLTKNAFPKVTKLPLFYGYL